MSHLYTLLASIALLTSVAPVAALHADPGEDILIPLHTDGATVQSGTSGVCLGCSVTNEDAVIHDDLSLHATVSIPVGLAGRAFVEVAFPESQPAGRDAGFVIGSLTGLADVTLLGSIEVKTYLNGEEQETATGANLLDLVVLSQETQRAVSFTTALPFDKVRISFGSVVGVLNQTAVFHAFSAEGGFPTSSEAGAPAEAHQVSVYPNPLSGSGTVELGLPAGHRASSVRLYTVLGQEVRALPIEPGATTLSLDGTRLPSGIYVLVVQSAAPDGATTRTARRFTVIGRR